MMQSTPDRPSVPTACVCWMLRTEFPLPAICPEFRPHPELTIHLRPTCIDCTHPLACHELHLVRAR